MRQKSRNPGPKPQPTPAPPSAAAQAFARRPDVSICLGLAIVTLAVYCRVVRFDFVNFDDPIYILKNVHVNRGFTWRGIGWAFTSFYAANWSPLTWLSHMFDCQWFGLRSGWHHAINVLLHTGAAVLLFAALKRMTGARWPSAFVAFLFALHPLHVESVAWVAERKDVLCALFWFLSLYFYADYAREPHRRAYLLSLGAFGCGLMAKPMIVTLPFTLLLLDFWPLRRKLGWQLVREKLPFFGLSAVASVLTFLAQQNGDAVRSLGNISAGLRFENALMAYGGYLVKTVWPAGLAAFYPYQFNPVLWQAAGAFALLAGISVYVVKQRNTYPYLAAGWFWFLGTLVPVIGLVQVGAQSSADRYTYVPMVGLGIVLAWGVADWLGNWPRSRVVLATAAIAACAVVTWIQVGYWSNSETLFLHAIDVTQGNYLAQNNLAEYYLSLNRPLDATPHLKEALHIRPAYPEAHANSAMVLQKLNQGTLADKEYLEAIRLRPNSEQFHMARATFLMAAHHRNDADAEFAAAEKIEPSDDEAHYGRARVLAMMGKADEAIEECRAAIRLRFDNVDAHRTLGVILTGRGRLDEAVAEYRTAARLMPGDVMGHVNLGTMLYSSGRINDAIQEFNEALRIEPNNQNAKRWLEVARQHK